MGVIHSIVGNWIWLEAKPAAAQEEHQPGSKIVRALKIAGKSQRRPIRSLFLQKRTLVKHKPNERVQIRRE